MLKTLLGQAMAAAVLLKFAYGCAGPAAAAAAGLRDSAPMSLQTLMQTRIDPAADELWDAVAFIASEQGEEDRRPRTPEDWAQVRQSAAALIAAASDLAAPGQWVARPDQSAAAGGAGPGEVNAADIQRRIDGDLAAFARRARALGTAAQKALAAIDANNADGLMNAGGDIDAACESCHLLYWYPQQLPPGRR